MIVHTVIFDLAGTTIDCGCLAEIDRIQAGVTSTRARRHVDPIPGFLPVLANLRAQGIRVGATVTPPAPPGEILAPALAAAGWRPDVLVFADEVPSPPPSPALNQLAAIRLGAPNVAGCVVVGDTGLDMEAARNAGMWAVGIAVTGADVGLPWPDLASLHRDERARLGEAAKQRLEAAGAHVVVDSVADLPIALEILRRPSMAALKRWQRPR